MPHYEGQVSVEYMVVASLALLLLSLSSILYSMLLSDAGGSIGSREVARVCDYIRSTASAALAGGDGTSISANALIPAGADSYNVTVYPANRSLHVEYGASRYSCGMDTNLTRAPGGGYGPYSINITGPFWVNNSEGAIVIG